jgi:hypothetical protein
MAIGFLEKIWQKKKEIPELERSYNEQTFTPRTSDCKISPL